MQSTAFRAARAVRMYVPTQRVPSAATAAAAVTSSPDVLTAQRIAGAVLEARKQQRLRQTARITPVPVPPSTTTTTTAAHTPARAADVRDSAMAVVNEQEAMRLALSYGKSALLTHLTHQQDDATAQRLYAFSTARWAKVLGEVPIGAAAARRGAAEARCTTADDGVVALLFEVDQTWAQLNSTMKLRWVTSTPQGRHALRHAMRAAAAAATAGDAGAEAVVAPAEARRTAAVPAMHDMLSQYPDTLVRPRQPTLAALVPPPKPTHLQELFASDARTTSREGNGRSRAVEAGAAFHVAGQRHSTTRGSANRESLLRRADAAREKERREAWLQGLAACLGGDNAVKFVNNVKPLQQPQEDGGGEAEASGAVRSAAGESEGREAVYSAGLLELCEELGIRSPRRAYVMARVLKSVDEAAATDHSLSLDKVRELTATYADEYAQEVAALRKNAEERGDTSAAEAVRNFEHYQLELAVDKVQVKLSKYQDDLPLLLNFVNVLNNGSAESGNLDEIRESLNRIESLYNRGQHVLYGDDGGEPADAGAVAAPAVQQTDSYHSYHSTPNKQAAARAAPAAHPPAPKRPPAPPVTTSPYHQAFYGPGARREQDHSSSTLHDSQARRHSNSSAVRGSHLSATRGSHHSAARRASKAKKAEEEELSASARALRIEEIKKASGRVPNFEDGVDDDDTAQNTSIEELKERIRRELEEYQRNGPLMHRRASFQRKQRAATVPRSSGPARASPAARPPAAAPSGPSASRSVPPPRPAAPKASATKRGVSGSPPPSKVQQVRAAPHPRAAKSAPPAQPTRSAVKKSSAASRQPTTTTTTAANGGQLPFWERLYSDAAVQQEKRDQRAEQRRIELEAERAKLAPRRREHHPPAHAKYSTYYRNLQANSDSANPSRDLSAPRSRAAGNVPPQHASYVPKRAAAPDAASAAPSQVAARRPVSQLAAKKPASAAAQPVPLPRGPAPRAAPEEEAEMKVPTPAPRSAGEPSSGSRGRSHEPFDEVAEAPAAAETAAPQDSEEEEEAVAPAAYNDDDDSDTDSEADKAVTKSSSHPFVAPLDFTGIKK